jgi:hypothetical protein
MTRWIAIDFSSAGQEHGGLGVFGRGEKRVRHLPECKDFIGLYKVFTVPDKVTAKFQEGKKPVNTAFAGNWVADGQ